MTLRTAGADDAPAIAAIYNQGIAERAATFDTDHVTAHDVGARGQGCGFREVGVYERHGRLDGEWKSLLIVERLLAAAAKEG